jgi:uncharacterized membrane protein YhaH (DUF805 family)
MKRDRINRREYIGYLVFSWIVTIIAVYVLGWAGLGGFFAFIVVLLVLALFIAAMVNTYLGTVRRFHDLGRQGMWSLLIFVPGVSFFLMLYLLFAAGQPGENEYGPAKRPIQYGDPAKYKNRHMR